LPSPAMPVKLVSSTDQAYGGLCKRGDFVDIEVWKEGTNFQPVPMLMSEYLGGGAVSGPVAWYRKGQGITVTGSGVSQWSDASGNGRHLLQATDAQRPALQTDRTILFDGVAHNLKSAVFTLNQPTTYYLLFKQVTWTSSDYIVDGDLINTGVLAQTNGGVSPGLQLYAGSGVGSNTDLALDTYGVAACVFNGASSVLQINNGTPLTGDAGAGNMGGVSLGKAGTGAGAHANVRVKELIVFSQAHNAAQRALVIAYLLTI
jgi:hypothetical protein